MTKELNVRLIHTSAALNAVSNTIMFDLEIGLDMKSVIYPHRTCREAMISSFKDTIMFLKLISRR